MMNQEWKSQVIYKIVAFSLMGSIANHMDESKTTNHFLNCHTNAPFVVVGYYNKYISKFPTLCPNQKFIIVQHSAWGSTSQKMEPL